jgi:hypothetical protein
MSDPQSTTFLRSQALGLGTIALIVYGITSFLIFPLHFNLIEARQTLSQIRQNAEQLPSNIDQLEIRRKVFEKKEKEVAERFTFHSEHSEDPLHWLKNLAEKTGLSITSFNDQRKSDPNTAFVIDISLTGSCTYQQLCDFLHHIERSSRPCFVNNLSISNSGLPSRPLALTAKLRIFPANETLSKLSKKYSDPSPGSNSLAAIPTGKRKP